MTHADPLIVALLCSGDWHLAGVRPRRQDYRIVGGRVVEGGDR